MMADNQTDTPVEESTDIPFLVGSERSGTTLLRLMLAHHGQLAWCQEFEYVVDQMTNSGQTPPMDQYARWLATHRIFQDSRFELPPESTYRHAAISILNQMAARQNKPLVGAVVHRHFDRLLHLWPKARFLHIVRDPRDVAQSVVKMGWAGNVWTAAGRWIEIERLADRLRHTVDPRRWLELRYETLVRRPHDELQRICDFIGVPFDPQMLQYHRDTTYDPPDQSMLQKWQRNITRSDIQLIESRVGQLLADRGYEAHGVKTIQIGPIRRARLALHDRLARHRFQIRTFGLGLWFGEMVARRMKVRT